MNVIITDWAKNNFDPPPKKRLLLTWARTGQIIPTPVKVGRDWYVDENAQYKPVGIDTGNLQVSDTVARILQGV